MDAVFLTSSLSVHVFCKIRGFESGPFLEINLTTSCTGHLAHCMINDASGDLLNIEQFLPKCRLVKRVCMVPFSIFAHV